MVERALADFEIARYVEADLPNHAAAVFFDYVLPSNEYSAK